jgi:hypothetical protein
VIVAGARAVRALSRSGPFDQRTQRVRDVDAVPAAVAPLDLARLFETDGVLTAEQDILPTGTRLSIVLPADLDAEVGRALVDLASRLGMESGGVDLPLATTGEPSPGRIQLRIRPEVGRPARLAALNGEDGPSLELTGEPAAQAELLRLVARHWPSITGTPASRTSAGEIVSWLRRSLAGWTPEGRRAAFVADMETLPPQPSGSRLRLLTHDEQERAVLARDAHARLGRAIEIVGPGASQHVLAQHWSARWEVDRALEIVREQILPQLIRGLPIRLTVVVSEPRNVRERLADDVRRLLHVSGFEAGLVEVVVLDAFKAGLCWLREIVLPGWSSLEGIDRVAIRYRTLDADLQRPTLDLRIRWLQELFPADEIIAAALGLPLDNVSLEEWDGPSLYGVEAISVDGSMLATDEFTPPTYSRPYLSCYPGTGQVHVVTGGVFAEQAGRTIRERIPTDLDCVWDYVQDEVLPRLRDHVLDATQGQPKRADQPFFSELSVEVWISETDEPFGIREERSSAAEALHEDLYFNALDLVEALGAETTGERLNAPGAVVPIVHVRQGLPPAAQVSLRSRPSCVAQIEPEATHEPAIPLGRIEAAPVGNARVAAIGLRDGQLQVEIAVDGLNDAAVQRLEALAALLPAPPSASTLLVRSGERAVELALPRVAESGAAPPVSGGVPEDEFVTEAELGPLLSRLERLSGVQVDRALDRSWEGRPIPAIEVVAPMAAEVWSPRKLSLFKPTFMVVARHHANEVASTTAALQLVEFLARDPAGRRLRQRVNVALLPFENPDGAALHDRLQREHPTWKHHPARYNAVGFEFGEDVANPDSPYGEARVRETLWRRWLPDVVVDNHGVPSHEWAQVFAGFGSPPRFTVSYWQVQALVYGILHFLDSPDFPEHRAAAFALRQAVSRNEAADAEILELNRTYRERYVKWGTSRVPERFPADVFREMIWYFGPHPEDRLRAARNYALRYPATTVISWVSEVADETAHGRQLRRTARAHLAANRATLDLLAAVAAPPARRIIERADGTARITLGRRRPIRLGL